jgi:lipopolysaccharide/colanic/teichoic acid biosynthesis glycosyltransferase
MTLLKNTHLIVIYQNAGLCVGENSNLLRLAVSGAPIADITVDGLRNYCFDGNDSIIAVPEEWSSRASYRHPKMLYHNGSLHISSKVANSDKAESWLVISDGSFVTNLDRRRLYEVLANLDADLVAVNVDPDCLSYRERVRVTSEGNVAGFSRLYSDMVLPAPFPKKWPHHLCIRFSVLNKVLIDDMLPLNFDDFVVRCNHNSLNWYGIKIGGTILDLETEAGLLKFLTSGLCLPSRRLWRANHKSNCIISPDARLFGTVILGKNVRIDRDVIITGPTIVGNDVKIGRGTVIRASVIGDGVSLPENCLVQNRLLLDAGLKWDLFSSRKNVNTELFIGSTFFAENGSKNNNHRSWPMFSYTRCVKRAADIIASLIVLILFAPIFPLIALAIKLNSKGPVFFKDRREGLHGREFFCLKFRTMIAGADLIQEKLRFINQVDGPQFKVENDPRVTAVGKFLRDTFIDETPQFLNILLGQMSVVGPRPSPKVENTSCPAWRDARLSVRPGITGLWQVSRTRLPGRDFQEWIYYDTEYVKNLSFKLDLWICLQTIKKLILRFLEQF